MEFFNRATIAIANVRGDAELLQYARMIQDIGRGEIGLHFVHVLTPGGTVGARTSSVSTHREALDELRSTIAKHFDGSAKVASHVLSGTRVDKLLEFVAESRSDLLLIGHGKSSTGRRSLARRLAMKASCSLWMVPQGSPAKITKVLAAVDFSAPSAYAVSLATLVAKRAGLRDCLAVHVQEPTSISGDTNDNVSQELIDEAFVRFLGPVDLNDVEVQAQSEESGLVSGTLLRLAEDHQADLLVMGTRGRSASAAVLLGSESEHVLTETTRPLLVTKHRGERIGLLQVLLDRDFQSHQEPRFG